MKIKKSPRVCACLFLGIFRIFLFAPWFIACGGGDSEPSKEYEQDSAETNDNKESEAGPSTAEDISLRFRQATEDDWAYRKADFTYDIPHTMTQGKSVYAKAIISFPGMATDSLYADSVVSPQAKTAQMMITRIMQVELKGSEEAFKIRPITEAEQFIDQKLADRWTWTWEVTPLTYGKHKLILVARAMRKDESTGKIVSSGTLDPVKIEISVRINRLFMISEFIQAYWQWLASAIAIPLIVWLYSLYSASRKREKETRKIQNRIPTASNHLSEDLLRMKIE